MKALILFMVLLTVTGCSLISEDVIELNKQYATVKGLETKIVKLEAKEARLLNEITVTEGELVDSNAKLEVEQQKLIDLVQ